MNAAKGPQEVTQAGPDAFHGVAMDFPDPIAIVITSPFFLGMTDRAVPSACSSHSIIGVTLIGVEGGGRPGLVFDFRLNGVLGGIIAHLQANLTSFTPDHPQNGRTVIGHRPFTGLFVGSAAGWVIRVIMFGALFPCILEHFIGFCLFICQRSVRFVCLRQFLDPMSTFQQGSIVHLQFISQVEGGVP